MEWFFPYYWSAAVDPTAWWGATAEPAVDDGTVGPDDLELVRIAYVVLVEGVTCGVCQVPLDPAVGVERTRGWFTAARIAVVTSCRGPQRHRHRATVVERAGDLQLGRLRPA